MPKEYTKEQLKKLKEVISPDVLEVLFSEKTSLKISEICIKNGVEEEEKIEEIAHQTGLVLLGQLLPNKFPAALEKRAKLDPLTIKKISQEINQAIFYPVKSSLEEIYKVPITPPPVTARAAPPTPPSEARLPEEKPVAPPTKDVYREPVE